jgi:hypothetical protein
MYQSDIRGEGDSVADPSQACRCHRSVDAGAALMTTGEHQSVGAKSPSTTESPTVRSPPCRLRRCSRPCLLPPPSYRSFLRGARCSCNRTVTRYSRGGGSRPRTWRNRTRTMTGWRLTWQGPACHL